MGIQLVETVFQNHSGLKRRVSDVSVSSFFTLTYGKCHAISSKSQSSVWGGDFGYFFYLTWTEMDQFVDPDLRGYRVFIHDESTRFTGNFETEITAGSIKSCLEKTQDTDSFLEHLFVEPGDALEIRLKVNEYRMLPNRQRICMADVSYSSAKVIFYS